MKPANDPNVNYKALVQQSHDLCAASYEQARKTTVNVELDLLTQRLSAGAAILDIGCSDYKRLLAKIGFDLLDTAVTNHGYTDAQEAAESHPVIFAQTA